MHSQPSFTGGVPPGFCYFFLLCVDIFSWPTGFLPKMALSEKFATQRVLSWRLTWPELAGLQTGGHQTSWQRRPQLAGAFYRVSHLIIDWLESIWPIKQLTPNGDGTFETFYCPNLVLNFHGLSSEALNLELFLNLTLNRIIDNKTAIIIFKTHDCWQWGKLLKRVSGYLRAATNNSRPNLLI